MNDKVKHEIFMMYDLAGDKDLIYYEAIQRIIDYIADLEQENERIKEIWEDIRTFIKDDKKLMMNKNGYDIFEDYKSRIEKANWWLKEMLKQAKSNETKAIISGTLELLLNGRSDE